MKVQTIAGSGQNGWADGEFLKCKFSNPHAICVDQVKKICYVADTNNYKIRSFSISQISHSQPYFTNTNYKPPS